MTTAGVAEDLTITLGIEEEFFLVDPETRDLLADPDPAIFEACERNRGPHKVVHEFLRSQIETNTRVCTSVEDAREALRETRRFVVQAAEAHGAVVLGSSTHPFAAWEAQMPTPKERYERFAMTFQESVRRLLVGGMHVHAGFGNADERIRIMTAVRRHLPLLHALSGSSPFSSGRATGFKSYRLNIMGALPRTSLPGPLGSVSDYDHLVDDYRRAQFISDGSELWWDIRPSPNFPTIEVRICDICPRIEDAISIAALYASLVRCLLRRARAGTLPPEPPTEIIAENRWLAQRYGVLAFLGHPTRAGRVDIADYAEEFVAELVDDARALGCEDEVRHALIIIRDGSGADRQLDHYRLRRLEGDSDEEALRSVVDLVIEETRAGIDAG